MKRGVILGLLLSPFMYSVVAQTSVRINEIVVDPQQDFNERGTITYLDEYIELFNTSGTESVNLEGWKFNLIDTTPESLTLTNIIIGPRELRVIQNPPGEQNNNGRLELYDNLGNLVDAVTYGNWNDGSGVPSVIPNGNASGFFNESLSRTPDGGMNWIKTFSSKGLPNLQPGERPYLSVSQQADKLEVIVSAVPGKRFILQGSGDLTIWENDYTNTFVGTSFGFDGKLTEQKRFYRAVEVP